MSEYENISAMEPLFPEDPSGILEKLAEAIVRKASALGELMHPRTRAAMAELVRPMNSYYSNLIEGHDTHPISIARALQEDYEEDEKKRDLQLEAKAHIALHKKIRSAYDAEKAAYTPSNSDFLKWLHAEFYAQLPDEFKNILSEEGNPKKVIPGEYRDCGVKVGRHVAPAYNRIPAFMERFSQAYDPNAPANKAIIKRIINSAASHHRLVWIHPFLDGNGRVVRLFSDACFMHEAIDASGLWSISRGLARSNDIYKSMLAKADSSRRGDYDGRGNLSNKNLVEFCQYFLKTALDQINFMRDSLQLDQMLDRLESFVIRASDKGIVREEAKYVLQEVFLRGSISKPDAERLMQLSDKPAKAVTDTLIKLQLLIPHKEGKVMMFYPTYPISISPWILPNLYPESKESEMMSLLMKSK